jgi:RNA polymerase sigma-70 factor (ECF subfamily)
MPGQDRSSRPPLVRFATTRWSVVRSAGAGDPRRSRRALSELCGIYWYPLYAFVRRRGYDADEAQDLTQAFFTDLLEREGIGRADPVRGHFRTFLLSSLQNFLAGEWRKRQTLKRGGDLEILSLDFATAESAYALEPVDGRDPETEFERAWALGLLERALADLRDHYAGLGKLELFEALKGALDGGGEALDYAELAARLGYREGALRTAVSRLRARWSHRIRDRVADTVDDEADVRSELQRLIAAVGK